MSLERVSENKIFGGAQQVWEHDSQETKTKMRFSVFVPQGAKNVPVVYFLSGLTCTEQNFTTKAGAQRIAAELGVVIVAPDTSPRGEGVANDEGYDLGQGAGFYVDATEAPWSAHYRMYSYVQRELPELVRANFPVDADRQGIMGHSMGGHGALVIGLRNPKQFRSVSALSPICAPSQCPWGEKALTAYLGEDRSKWAEWDAEQLVRSGHKHAQILIDQGTEDQFLVNQLKPELLEQTCQEHGQPLHMRRQEGYDHSYYFIASFIGDHLLHHVGLLSS